MRENNVKSHQISALDKTLCGQKCPIEKVFMDKGLGGQLSLGQIFVSKVSKSQSPTMPRIALKVVR